MAGHHGFSYFPPAIYADLVVLSRENDLSVKELEVMFVRYWVEKITKRKCDHPTKKLKYDKDREKDKWHCTQCWRRFDQKESIIYENGKVVKKIYYEPVVTYVDRLVAEAEEVTEANKQQFPEETKVLGKLVPNE